MKVGTNWTQVLSLRSEHTVYAAITAPICTWRRDQVLYLQMTIPSNYSLLTQGFFGSFVHKVVMKEVVERGLDCLIIWYDLCLGFLQLD